MRIGHPETALAEPNTIVLTQSLAEKIFGDENPMGKTLTFQNQEAYTVTGVIEDVPDNAHFTFSFVRSLVSSSDYLGALDYWSRISWYTYFVLQEEAAYAPLQAKMEALAETYYPDENPEKRWQYIIQPLTSIHLRSHTNFELSTNGNTTSIYLFFGIALAILLLACVNYMNLAVARSVTRAREVGMRKVVGANRRQLVTQFIGESVLLAMLALMLAIALVLFVLPVFSAFVERDLSLDYAQSGLLLLALVGMMLLVGVISGSYPALFMASLEPTRVLKGRLEHGSRRSRLRSLLVVGQYAVSIMLVAGSLIMYQQMRFIQSKEMGYNRDHVVTMRVRDQNVRENVETIRSELLRQPNILGVTSSGHLPTRIDNHLSARRWEGSREDEQLMIYGTGVNYDFLEVFGIELVEGRTFSRAFATDTSRAYLFNETAVKALGWEAAVGKQIDINGEGGRIIGVVKDFHLQSLHQAIEPLLLYLDSDWKNYLSVKVAPENLRETLASIEGTIQAFSSYPFEYQFLDEAFDQLYKTELKLGQLIGLFTLLALLIASLGLFGLAAYTAEQRTKEVGIRKVLGATAPGLVILLSKEFTRLVVVAFVVAVPVAYYGMNQWLEVFAYRVKIGPMVFFVAPA